MRMNLDMKFEDFHREGIKELLRMAIPLTGDAREESLMMRAPTQTGSWSEAKGVRHAIPREVPGGGVVGLQVVRTRPPWRCWKCLEKEGKG